MKGQWCRCATWAGRESASPSNFSIGDAASPLPFLTWGDQVLLHKSHVVEFPGGLAVAWVTAAAGVEFLAQEFPNATGVAGRNKQTKPKTKKQNPEATLLQVTYIRLSQ